MDALIRFCFSGITSEKFFRNKTVNDCYNKGVYEKRDEVEEYFKIYAQAKFVWEHITVTGAAKALQAAS